MKKHIIAIAICWGFAATTMAQKISLGNATLASNSSSIAQPLIIIDGHKQYIRGTASVNGIDPKNIESVTVWKDSSAISKYGIDGYAGVVEIKLKMAR